MCERHKRLEYGEDVDLPEYEAFLQNHPEGHFAQSVRWGRQKKAWQFCPVAVRGADGTLCGCMGLLIRSLPLLPVTILYACRGPVCDPRDTETLGMLIDGAKTVAARHHGCVIKIDPAVPRDAEGFSKALTALGFRPVRTRKLCQPRAVFRLDLQGKTQEDLLKGFSAKHRYNLRVAQRRGVEIHRAGREGIPIFSALMEQTARRDRFLPRPEGYFASLMEQFGEDIRLYLAYYQGKPIAGTMALGFGNKVWYLYGASGNAHRDTMPNYLLQWTMILWALERNADWYDFRGVSGNQGASERLEGLYRFKKGFGGTLTEFVGEWDLVVQPVGYRIWTLGLGLFDAVKAYRAGSKETEKIHCKMQRFFQKP